MPEPPSPEPVPPRPREWPITVVLTVVVLALGIVATGRFRYGTVLLAAGVVLAFFLRALLPRTEIGMLAVRSRTVDLLVLGVLGGTLSVLALWTPSPD